MSLTQADREEIALLIREGQAQNAIVNQCRADYPHEGKLRYNRGNPGVYTCECGKRYEKDGRGGLRDAPAIRPALVGG
jgi:hypothetical protein